MSFNDFLTLLNQNTNNQIDNYKWLCRFCLQPKSGGIDVGNDSDNTKQQIDSLLNNHHIITKTFLPITTDYPNFVCSKCEFNVHQCAVFIQKIEQNADNWENFLNRDNDENVNDEYITDVIGTEEIKVECCEENFDYSTYNESNPSLIDDETSNEIDIKRDSPISSQLEFLNDDNSTMNIQEDSTCNISGSKFYNEKRLITHMEDTDSEDAKKYQSDELLLSNRSLKRQRKIHLNENARSFTCSSCGESFNRRVMLNNHLKSTGHNAGFETIQPKKSHKYIESTKRKQLYPCVLCVPPTIFSSSGERHMHKNSIHATFECDVCKNSFKSQETLNSHKLRHSDEPRPFVCTECNAKFHKKAHLGSHFRRKHTNDRSIRCQLCDKRFFEEFELTRHVNFVHIKHGR